MSATTPPVTTAPLVMTRRDREDLARLARLRERVAKTSASQRKAELLADFERQLGAIHSYDDDETWRALKDDAQQAVDEADRRVAERCRELGIPSRFRPFLHLSWHGRGENAAKERRAELRRIATTRLDALEKQAKAEIEARSAVIQTEILAGGLETSAARAFLESMPTPEALMPPLDAKALLAAENGRHGAAVEAQP